MIAVGRVLVVAGQGTRESKEVKPVHSSSTATSVSTAYGQTSNRYQVMQVSNLFRGGQPDTMGALDTWAEVHERDELVLMSATSADLQDLPAKAVWERRRLLQQRKLRRAIVGGRDDGEENKTEATGVQDDDARTGVEVLGCIFACNLGAVQQLQRKRGSVRRMVEALEEPLVDRRRALMERVVLHLGPLVLHVGVLAEEGGARAPRRLVRELDRATQDRHGEGV